MAKGKIKAKAVAESANEVETETGGKLAWGKISTGVIGVAALSSAAVTLDTNLRHFAGRLFGGVSDEPATGPAKITTTRTSSTTTTTTTSPAGTTTTVSRTEVIREVAFGSAVPSPPTRFRAPEPAPPEPISFANIEPPETPPPPSPPPPPPIYEQQQEQQIPPVPTPCVSGPFIVYFDWDRDGITPQAAAILDNAAAAYPHCNLTRVAVAGHADRSGAADYNLGLSERRANTVRAYLAGRGIAEGAIGTEAFGEARPLVETADGVREPQNRRVEVTFGPDAGW